MADENLLVLTIWQSCLSFCGVVFYFSHVARPFRATALITRETKALLQSVSKNIAFLVHGNHFSTQINHSKFQFNKLVSLLIQFNKIEIQTHFQNFIIKCAFTLINCVV